jgi:hypothetical protein
MALATLDTHELVKDLKSAGCTDEQAEAVTRAVKWAHDVHLSDLATKADLLATKAELKADISLLRSEMSHFTTKSDLAEMRIYIVKWVFGIVLGQATLVLAVLRFLPAHS